MATILIADDEKIVRQFIKRTLEKDNYSFIEASNGDEALRILKDEKIDLLIIDLVMPQKSGLETLMDLRSLLPELKILLITGAVDVEQRFFKELVDQLGVSHVLKKPFEPGHLRDEVRTILTG